jgi:hypothetical protein
MKRKGDNDGLPFASFCHKLPSQSRFQLFAARLFVTLLMYCWSISFSDAALMQSCCTDADLDIRPEATETRREEKDRCQSRFDWAK